MLSLKAFLGLDGSGFELGIKKAQSSAQKFSKSISSELTGKLGGLFTVAAVEQGIQKIVEYAGHIQDLSDQLGISTDEFQKWDHALRLAGGDAESAAKFFEHLAEFREKALSGDEGALANAKLFGISHDDLKNKRLEDLGKQIGSAFQSGDQQKLIAGLREIGGKGVRVLVGAMRNGLEEEMANAPLLSEKDIADLDKIGDEFATLGKGLMAAFAPVIAFLGRSILGITDSFKLAFDQIAVAGATLLGGGSIKDAVAAYKTVTEEFEKSRADKAKNNVPQTPFTRKPGTSKGSKKDNRFHGEEAAYDPVLGPRSNVQSSINTTPLQQIGAHISAFNPMLTEIQKNTMAVKENTAAQRATKNRLPAPGSGGNLVEY